MLLQVRYFKFCHITVEDFFFSIGGALMLAQVLAGAGTNGINLSGLLGKRDLSELAGRQEELRGFFDTLGNALLDSLQTVWTNVLQNPVEQALQS
jgi:hypothetical protein